MRTVQTWTGCEVAALRAAMRLSIRDFAEQLGLGVRTVTKWSARGRTITLHPRSQALMDETLERVDGATRSRFEYILRHNIDSADGDQTSGHRVDGAPPTHQLDALRLLIDEMADRGGVDDQLNRLEAAVERHAVAALSTPPRTMLDRLAVDVADVHRVAAAAGTHLAARTAKVVAAQLAAMVADEYTVIGNTGAAQRWYNSAARAADASGHHALRCDVRALAAMLPLYHGEPTDAAQLAESAYASAGGAHCVGACRAAVLAAVARSAAGDATRAIAALTAAKREFDSLADVHRLESIFGISARRFLFYEGRVLLACREYSRAMKTFDEAIQLYPAQIVGDTTLIRLGQADCLIQLGEVEGGVEAIVSALGSVPTEHRAPLFTVRAREALKRVPRGAMRLPAVRIVEDVVATWPQSTPALPGSVFG